MIGVGQCIDDVISDASFSALKNHIIASTGLVYYTDRTEALATYVGKRLESLELTSCREYLQLLKDGRTGEVELDSLIALLTIGETYFFRHRELFDALRDQVAPNLIERNRPTKRLRVWSAGCSTGAEAYSLSILLRRELGDALHGWDISIVGTDINRPCLTEAAEGCYEDWAFRGTSPTLRTSCFETAGKSWRISPRFKEGVSFQYHNLVRHPFPSLVHHLLAFDLILCRNVLIYFSPETVGRIVSQLADCLVPGGWLAVGHAEYGSHLHSSFEVVSCKGATLYRKRTQPANETNCIDFSTNTVAQPVVVHPPRKVADIELLPIAVPTPLNSGQASRPDTPVPANVDEIGKIRLLADEGNLGAALRLCEVLVGKDSLNAKYHFYHALLLEQAARHQEALHALVRVIYLDREFELAYYHLGLSQMKTGDEAAARKSFQNLLKLIEHRDLSDALPDAEELSLADLRELTQMHLETLEKGRSCS